MKNQVNIIDRIFDFTIADIPILAWILIFPLALMILIVRIISESKFLKKLWKDAMAYLFE